MGRGEKGLVLGEQRGILDQHNASQVDAGAPDAEAWRRECEAREWLRRLGCDPKRIKAKLKRIGEVRGKVAADELAEAMRKEWQRGRTAVD